MAGLKHSVKTEIFAVYDAVSALVLILFYEGETEPAASSVRHK